MTFKKFKKDLLAFIGNSTVNLGRKNTQTRAKFLQDIESKLTAFETDDGKLVVVKDEEKSEDKGRIIRMMPKNKRKALDIGKKGVVAMTGSESARADEELGRSPFTNKTEKKE